MAVIKKGEIRGVKQFGLHWTEDEHELGNNHSQPWITTYVHKHNFFCKIKVKKERYLEKEMRIKS